MFPSIVLAYFQGFESAEQPLGVMRGEARGGRDMKFTL